MTGGFPHLSFGHMRCVQQLIAVLQVMLLQDQPACEQTNAHPGRMSLKTALKALQQQANEAKVPKQCKTLLLPKQIACPTAAQHVVSG